MNKDLIDLQRNSKGTCAIVLDEFYKNIGQELVMNANIADEYLFARPAKNPIFKEKLDILSSNKKLTYFVIRNIDQIDYEKQNRYISLVKDRELIGYNLPQNVILVFTISNKENLSKISKDLYHFCVVAF